MTKIAGRIDACWRRPSASRSLCAGDGAEPGGGRRAAHTPRGAVDAGAADEDEDGDDEDEAAAGADEDDVDDIEADDDVTAPAKPPATLELAAML